MSSPCIVLAGGGTGGHIFPLLAVASALQKRVVDLRPVFVGTDRGLESKLVPPTNIPLELMHSVPFRGGGLQGAVVGLLGVLRCLPHSLRLLRKYKPGIVLSSGGYAAVPIALAARIVGIPLALIEPNGAPGLANRVSGPMACRVYTVFDSTAAHFRTSQVLRAGHALREGFERVPYLLTEDITSPLKVLVLGGSQGAASLNQAFSEALTLLKIPLVVTHQVGHRHRKQAEVHYQHVKGYDVKIVDFIDNMPQALRHADLVVSRAGTGHIAETCAVGRPSVLIPLASSGVGQLHNAQAIEAAGAAICIPAEQVTAATIAEVLSRLHTDRGRLIEMANCAAQWGRPQAAEEIAADLVQLGDWQADRVLEMENSG